MNVFVFSYFIFLYEPVVVSFEDSNDPSGSINNKYLSPVEKLSVSQE
jgi:hypothetical protein